MKPSLYDQSFYDEQLGGSQHSAKIVLPKILEWINPKSMIDFGCGRGAWLAKAKECGVEQIIGMDGPWSEPSLLLSKEIQFKQVDFEKMITLDHQCDFALSLEVAEHISATYAEVFIESICGAADVALFGAAIPGQGGVGHVNEQWPSYWAKIFHKFNFLPFDIVRPYFWNNKEVEIWYRQNTLLFAKKGSVIFDQLCHSFSPTATVLDYVHPEAYLKKLPYETIVHQPTVRFSLGSLKKSLLKKMGIQ